MILHKHFREMQRLRGLKGRMLAAPDQQISLTDPDSRSMATRGRGSGVVGYNEWEHEHILEAVQRRLDEHPEKMRQRRETVAKAADLRFSPSVFAQPRPISDNWVKRAITALSPEPPPPTLAQSGLTAVVPS
jgi:hypothetical protein